MTTALLLLVVLGLLGLVVYAVTSGARVRTEAPSPLPPEAPAAGRSPPPYADDIDEDDMTIIGVAPMLLGEQELEWADAEVTDAKELGSTIRIVHDATAADEEESAAFALMLVSAVGMSHQGRRRQRNEDRYLVLERHNLFVVADGMGGYVGGQVAAQMAVDAIQLAFDSNDFTGAAGPDLPRDGAQLAASFQMANRSIFERSGEEPELQGMGTTLVGARFSPRKERLYVANVGDSRCYRLRGTALEQLTADHTLGAMGVEGRTAHQLTRAVGVAPGVEVDLILVHPEVGDRYLLCSDGLTKMVPESEITNILSVHADAERAAEALIQRANAGGGKDNITVILVNVAFPGVGVVPHDKDTEEAQARDAAERAAAFAAESRKKVDSLLRTALPEEDDGEPE